MAIDSSLEAGKLNSAVHTAFKFVMLLNIPKITTNKAGEVAIKLLYPQVFDSKLVLSFRKVIWQCELEVIKMLIFFHLVIFLLEMYSTNLSKRRKMRKVIIIYIRENKLEAAIVIFIFY